MLRLILVTALVFVVTAVNAQVEFVKRSDMWAHELGKSVGQGAAAHEDFKGYMRGRDDRYRKLAELKQQVAACGKCADHARLTKEATALEARLQDDDRRLCSGFESQSAGNPAVGAMSKLLGVAPICDELRAQSNVDAAETRHKAHHAEFAQKAKAGDVAAYGIMGQQTMNTFRHLPHAQRLARACPYWRQGAQKGDALSTSSLAAQCRQGAANATLAAKGSGPAAGTKQSADLARTQAENRANADARQCESATRAADKMREAVARAPANQANFNALRLSRMEQNRDKACARSQQDQALAKSR